MLSHVEKLFLNTITDLECRVTSREEYDLLGISAIVRKLFLDSNSLVDQVNKEIKLKLNFEIGEEPPLPTNCPKPDFSSLQDGLAPEDLPPGFRIKTKNRDEFFSTVVATVKGKCITVKDIIKFEANISGGVHIDTPKKENEIILSEISQKFLIFGHRIPLRQLKSIAKVILKSLIPLKNAIQNK